MEFMDLLLDSIRLTWEQVSVVTPRLVIALLLFTAAWLIARLARAMTVRLLRLLRLEAAAERTGIEDFLLRGGVRYTAVTLTGTVVYWGVLLIGVLATFNALGLQVDGGVRERVVSYLPNVMVAIVIVVFGSLLSRFLGGLLHTYFNNIGVIGARRISLLAQASIMAFVLTLALEQLRIGVEVLRAAFQLAFGGLCLALALAFGLGGREWAASILDRTRKRNDR